MNKALYNFYAEDGWGGSDHKLRSWSEMMDEPNKWWEETHDFIQWLFPTRTVSMFNLHAPLLDDETITQLTLNHTAMSRLLYSYLRFRVFLEETRQTWQRPNNHNLLRITRVIESLALLGRPVEARALLEWASTECAAWLSDETFAYWTEALNAK